MIAIRKTYDSVRFTREAIQSSIDNFIGFLGSEKCTGSFEISDNSMSMTFSESTEFFIELSKNKKLEYSVRLHSGNGQSLNIDYQYITWSSTISIDMNDRINILSIASIFDSFVDRCKIETVKRDKPKPVIFIGHGGKSGAWKDLKNHLQDHHGYQVECYESGARAGHNIRDILESMLKKSSLALLVMTAEDEAADGSMHPRPNVIHEAGLFQGRLGFTKAIILKESGADLFSNVDGIQYIPFSKGNIRETFGDVLASIKRETGS